MKCAACGVDKPITEYREYFGKLNRNCTACLERKAHPAKPKNVCEKCPYLDYCESVRNTIYPVACQPELTDRQIKIIDYLDAWGVIQFGYDPKNGVMRGAE